MNAAAETILCGRLTADPDLGTTENGTPWAILGVEVAERFQSGREERSFICVTVYRDLAEHVAASLHLGDQVVVIGRLVQRAWATDTGEVRGLVQVIARDVALSLTAGPLWSVRPESLEAER